MKLPNTDDFPFASDGWSTDAAVTAAREEGLEMEDAHWSLIQGLQEYFAKNEEYSPRELTDALEERFHRQGGMRYLYRLCPKGPVAQGCRLAGITPPAGAVDPSFGSVM